jgi:hypothetical protein
MQKSRNLIVSVEIKISNLNVQTKQWLAMAEINVNKRK